jgi:hypothetical protein
LAWTIEPDVVDPGLDLNGKIPIATDSGDADHTRDPGVVDPGLDLTGKQATLAWTIEPDVVDPGLDLTGKQATLAWTIEPDVVDPGLDLTGKAPQILLVTPDNETAILSGKIPVVNPLTEREIPVSKGFLTLFSVRGLQLRGITPSVSLGSTVAPLVAEPLTTSGKEPEVLFEIPGKRSLTLTGKVPRLGRGFSYTIPIDEDTLNLTGKIPTRPVGLTIYGHEPNTDPIRTKRPASRPAFLTGHEAILYDTSPQDEVIPVSRRPMVLEQKGNVALEVDVEQTEPPSLTLNMMQPTTVDSSPTFLLGADNLALTPKLPFTKPIFILDTNSVFLQGRDPVIRRSTNARPLPDKGGIALSGKEPSVFPRPDTIPLTLSGHEPSVGKREIRVNRRNLTLTGKLPKRLEQNYEVYPDRLVLRILRNDTNYVNVGFTVVPGNDSLAATGKIPLFEYDTDTSRIPKKQDLVLTPQLPNIWIATTITVGGNQLVISNEQVTTIEKRFRRYGARNRFVRLTTRRSIEMLYR